MYVEHESSSHPPLLHTYVPTMPPCARVRSCVVSWRMVSDLSPILRVLVRFIGAQINHNQCQIATADFSQLRFGETLPNLQTCRICLQRLQC